MRYFLLLLLLVSCASLSFTQKRAGQKKTVPPNEMDEKIRSPFRYVIVSDRVDPKLDKKDEDRRFVEALLDPASFSKENLIELFRLLSKRFPKPEVLNVTLFTNLIDVETPDERDLPKFSDSLGGKFVGDHAVFVRTREGAFFYMYFANGDFEEIVVKSN